MINALEKVVYPNGKTQSLAEIGGAVEGLSALIDEVDKNTSAITSITSQLSALVADVDTNTSAISSINQQLGQLVGDWTLYNTAYRRAGASDYLNSARIDFADVNDFANKDILLNVLTQDETTEGTPKRVLGSYQMRVDGDVLLDNFSKEPTHNTTPKFLGGVLTNAGQKTVNTTTYNLGVYFTFAQDSSGGGFFIANSSLTDSYYRLTFNIYTKDKPTPPTRTAKKKAVVKKKGETK